MDAKFTFDMKEFEAALVDMKAQAPRVVEQALDRAAAAAVTDLVKTISADTALPPRKVRDKISVSKAPGARTIKVDARRVPLIDFKAKGPEPSRGKGRGVTYALPGGRGNAPHAFVAPGPRSGQRGVFQRLAGVGRGPLIELHGPSLFVAALKRAAEAGAAAMDKMRERLVHEINRRSGGK